jgi:hypothetical protein
MKGHSGMKDRDERSKGIKILMTDVFAKIKPSLEGFCCFTKAFTG